jgi:hypothetical protein
VVSSPQIRVHSCLFGVPPLGGLQRREIFPEPRERGTPNMGSLLAVASVIPAHRRASCAIRGLKLTPFQSRSVAAATFAFYVAHPVRSIC